MIAGEGWHNQTGERTAEEFIPRFCLIKSFSLLSCMPMGRWGGQSPANRQLRYECKDPSAVGTILSRFPEHHTVRSHTAKPPLNPSQVCFPLSAIDALRSGICVCLITRLRDDPTHPYPVWHSSEHKMCYQRTSAAKGEAHTQPCPPYREAPCQRSSLARVQLSLTGTVWLFFFL